jgi:hypothetical protein
MLTTNGAPTLQCARKNVNCDTFTRDQCFYLESNAQCGQRPLALSCADVIARSALRRDPKASGAADVYRNRRQQMRLHRRAHSGAERRAHARCSVNRERFAKSQEETQDQS